MADSSDTKCVKQSRFAPTRVNAGDLILRASQHTRDGRPLWGAQAASLPHPAACRVHLQRVTG